MRLEASIIDLAQIYKSIEGLSDIEKNRIIRGGLRNAANLFVKAGRNSLRARTINKTKGTGNLSRSIGVRVKSTKLGVLAGFSKDGWYAHLVDLGTESRFNRKGNRGVMPANKFWTDAINNSQDSAMSKVMEGIDRGVTRILMRG